MSKIDTFKTKTFKHSLKDVYEYLSVLEKGINGDMVLVVIPATLGSSAAEVTAAIAGEAEKYTRNITIELQTADGERCTFLNGNFDIAVSETTAGDGVSAIAGSATTITLTEGVGVVTVEYTGTWAEGDTQTLTLTGGSKLGYTIADKTSVDTLIA